MVADDRKPCTLPDANPPTNRMLARPLIESVEDIRVSFINNFQKARIARGEKPAERTFSIGNVVEGTPAVTTKGPASFGVTDD